jgi:hypothetical protein
MKQSPPTTSKEPTVAEQFTPITPADLNLKAAEHDDTGRITEDVVRGYRIAIEQSEDGKSFKWTVMATEAVSETPEVIDDSSRYSHTNRGARQAVRMALVMLNKHLREAERPARKAEREVKAKADSPTKPKRQKAAATA